MNPVPLPFSKNKNNNKDGNLYLNVKTDIFVTKFNDILVVLGQNAAKTTKKHEHRLYK